MDLEGLCSGIERLEASFTGRAFAPHRHDTYAIGITLAGVQRFGYRGEGRYCLPGQLHILHPDELHDGEAGTEEGFHYRIAYIDPARIAEAAGGALPFVADPVVILPPERLVALAPLWQNGPEDEADLTVAVADLLLELAGSAPRPLLIDRPALARVRDFIATDPARPYRVAEMERLSGLDRWTLARQFRLAYGTSPSRFRTLRQLDRVRSALRRGRPMVEAALDAGFADQSHMNRQFKSAYGLSPRRWQALV